MLSLFCGSGGLPGLFFPAFLERPLSRLAPRQTQKSHKVQTERIQPSTFSGEEHSAYSLAWTSLYVSEHRDVSKVMSSRGKAPEIY